MIRTAGCDVFKDDDHMVLDVYLCTKEDTVRYARKSIPIGDWDLMDKMDVVSIVHDHLQALREVG